MSAAESVAPRSRIGVTHLIHTMAYGGVETSVLNWLSEIDRTSFDVQLVCFANPDGSEAPFVDAAGRFGLPVDKIRWSRRKPLLRAAGELRELMQSTGSQILHAHNAYADMVAAVVRHMLPIRTLTTLYVWGDFGWKRNLLQWVDQRVIRDFDLVTAHCENTSRETVRRGVPSARVRTLISGFDPAGIESRPADRPQRRQALGIESDQILLANVARFYPEKAQDALLRIFRKVVEEHPEAVLWLLGTGPLEADLRRLHAELELGDRVRFAGFVSDVRGFLPLADVQVHPSINEGVPLAILEGLSAGLPVVASAVGGIPEVVIPDRTGVLVPPGDEVRFAEELIRLIRNRSELDRLGRGARRFIEEDYSLARAVRQVEETYREVSSA